MKTDEVFRCLAKGVACATCEERPFCRDIEVVQAKETFEEQLFAAIIRNDEGEFGKMQNNRDKPLAFLREYGYNNG